MNSYANPWNGSRQFYKGKPKKLPSATTDIDYLNYCDNKKNKSKILSYEAWCRKQRKQSGMF